MYKLTAIIQTNKQTDRIKLSLFISKLEFGRKMEQRKNRRKCPKIYKHSYLYIFKDNIDL